MLDKDASLQVLRKRMWNDTSEAARVKQMNQGSSFAHID